MFKYSSVSFDLVELRFINSEVANAYVKWTSTTNQDVYNPEGKKTAKKGDIDHSIMSLVFIKKNSRWFITSVTKTIIDLNAAPYDPVKRN